MTESLSLARCKPLSDPVRALASMLPVLALIPVAIILVIAWTERVDEAGYLIFVLITLVAVSSTPLGFWLFFRTANREPAIYLRAFRSDRQARRLRSLLKAALGSGFRLCGIRPPRERSHLLIRLVAQNLVAFRYIGSESFELEGDDRDWMARLLSTYAKSAFVFVDLRDLTEHVENEIRLSYLAMGPERCVFLIDSNRAKDEWLQVLHAVVGGDVARETDFIFLEYLGDETVDAKIFIGEARSVIDRLPTGPVVISEKAIAFAREHVGGTELVTSFWHTDRPSQLFYPVVVGLAVFKDQLGPFIILPVIIGVATWVMFFVAWGRAWKQGRIDKRYRRPGARSPRWRLGFSLFLVLFFPAYSALCTIATYSLYRAKTRLRADTDYARYRKVKADIQAISTELNLYESSNGFYPTTEQGLQALVTLPRSEPKPQRWYQLFTKLPNDPWGMQYNYRCPGVKHEESFDLFSSGADRTPETQDDVWGEE
jgi:type II secretion system protein G